MLQILNTLLILFQAEIVLFMPCVSYGWKSSLSQVEAGEGNWANFQMLWFSNYFLTSHRVSVNELNTPRMKLIVCELLWGSFNTFAHPLNVIVCTWLPLTACEHPLNIIECVWTPLSEYWTLNTPWVQLSVRECLWVSIEKRWMHTSISQIIGQVQIESDEHWH